MNSVAQRIAAAALVVVLAACGTAASPTPATTAPTASAVPATPAGPTPVPVPTPATTGGIAVLPVAASARVTLGIYSGRPDPAWELTKDETDKLVTFIDQMPPALGPAPQGGLGYHGFTVEITGVDGSIANVTAYAAVISIAGGVDRRKIDDGKHLERFLLETGRPTLTADEYTITKQALDDLLR